ncbi:hypothetical protein Misp05_41110 [Micromonospora sp. NBRC 107095]|nr:hypothetical protein Misp05_41110 [Micromonospora sp. NBRC 107095]
MMPVSHHARGRIRRSAEHPGGTTLAGRLGVPVDHVTGVRNASTTVNWEGSAARPELYVSFPHGLGDAAWCYRAVPPPDRPAPAAEGRCPMRGGRTAEALPVPGR